SVQPQSNGIFPNNRLDNGLEAFDHEREFDTIENLVRNGMNKELRDRLCCRLTFGTAGLRSAMGAGFCYINDLTVIQSTQLRTCILHAYHKL
uniref:Phosphoglucomutase n=1 Tax=Chrysemys picta bellii TaxID=8478 RepID=A0A8C3G0R7_CHRPI